MIFGPSLGSATLNEATLAALFGYSVAVADVAMWTSFTTVDFAQFDAIIIGDAGCIQGTTPLTAAEDMESSYPWTNLRSGNGPYFR